MFQLPLALLFDTPRNELPPAGAIGRRIALKNGVLGYGLVRARRRTLGILVGARGVEVRAPRWASVADIERFIREKEDWIWRHLNDRRAEKEAFSWNEGGSLPIFGVPTALEVRRIAASPKERLVRAEENRLIAHLHADDGIEQLRSQVQSWLRNQLLATGTARAQHFSSRLGVPTPSVRLSNARTRWGSCSAAGRVSLNWRLIHMPPRLIDYVVAHEIAHLREMNHSTRFWAILEEIYPDCREARREINRLEKQLPDL